MAGFTAPIGVGACFGRVSAQAVMLIPIRSSQRAGRHFRVHEDFRTGFADLFEGGCRFFRWAIRGAHPYERYSAVKNLFSCL